jgi:RNA polymerase sigma factor (sigma-70 family)
MSLDDSDKPNPAWNKILEHSTKLHAMIVAMVRDFHLANETLSDVRFMILKTWERYDPARPFWPWAREVTRRVALANLRERHRQALALDPEVMDQVAEDAGSGGEAVSELWRDALSSCVDALKTRHRRLVEYRWFKDLGYEEISGLEGRSVPTLQVTFHRIHSKLRDCVLKKIKDL